MGKKKEMEIKPSNALVGELCDLFGKDFLTIRRWIKKGDLRLQIPAAAEILKKYSND